MVSRNRVANVLAVNLVGSARKWANLESQSTTTGMTIFPPEDVKCMITSTKMSFQTCMGIGMG